MNINKKNLSIQALALIGLGLTIKLAFIYYAANYDKYALSSFCSINDFIDCDGAAKTNTAQFCGIPLAYWGIFFYLTVLFLTFVDKLKSIKFLHFLEVFKNPVAYIATLGSIAFVISMVLAGISFFGIHKICILCIATYIIDLIIALVASDGMFKNIISAFKTTFVDFISGAKKYTKTFLVLLILATSFLVYSGVTLNFVPHIKQRKDLMKYRKIKYNPYRIKGNVLGNPEGKVVIELYSDYVCPLCYVQNIMLHQAVKDYKNIKIIHHNYPFDKDCNPYISINMHPKACFMAKGAIASRKQNNYWEMSSLLYENQPKNMEDMLSVAEKAGLDKDLFLKDFESKETLEEIQDEVDNASLLEIDATPTMFINGKEFVGVKPYYKLKKILEDNGAK
ncbi:MAG: hypothetical protein E7Z92_07600 [Cyanobacteria bacterium SIG31]|nr:hypothetical protein [Cyanobacteria bacterium SIG31]